jgi:hypothetical protein
MKKSELKSYIKETIVAELSEDMKGAIELPSNTPPSAIKKYTDQNIDVELVKEEDEEKDLSPIFLSDQDATGTSFHNHTVTCSPQSLFDLIGEPQEAENTGRDKVNYRWICETDKGDLFTIYDYKEYRPLSDNEQVEWHIGARSSKISQQAKDDIESYLNLKENKKPIKEEEEEDDEEKLDKKAQAAAKKSGGKVGKLQRITAHLKELEKEMKELVNKWKKAEGKEKEALLDKLKEKTKVKKELEALESKLADAIV